MTARGVVFNGRFLNGRARGLSRTAVEMIRALDELLVEGRHGGGDRSWEVVCRRDAAERLTGLKRIVVRRDSRLNWPLWEQVELPHLLRGRLLVNLCNMSPLSVSGAITFIHDAHVFIMPQSHTRGYALWHRFALPKVARAAGRVVTVSQFSRESLAGCGVVGKDRVEVIGNGGEHLLRVAADAGVLALHDLPPGGFVLALANCQPHKNIRVLLQAWSRALVPGQRLVLVGAHGAETFAAAGSPPPPGVVFAGDVTDAELRALYEAATCFCCPSLLEGFGLPVVEAMTLGCPVVAAPGAALVEVCGDGGLFADPFDPVAWADAIAQCAIPAVRTDLQARGGRQSARFNWRTSALRLLRLIEEVAPGEQAPLVERSEAA